MKFKHIALSAATVFASTTALAGMVTTSANIDFLAVDGQKASKSLLKETRSVNIQGGEKHQLVVRVAEVIRVGSDRELFESDPIVVTFQAPNDDIVISAPHIENDRDASAFRKNPQITLKTASGTPVSSVQEYLKQEGFLPNVNLVDNLSEYNASGAKAAVPSFAAMSMPAAVPGLSKAQKGKVVVQGENMVEQQLQYWFQQADQETRQRFLKWATK